MLRQNETAGLTRHGDSTCPELPSPSKEANSEQTPRGSPPGRHPRRPRSVVRGEKPCPESFLTKVPGFPCSLS